jgi:hypothetical protein
VSRGAVRWDPRLPVTYLAVVLIGSAVVLAPAVRSAAATAADVFASVPPAERGMLFAGTEFNPFNACRPLHRTRDHLTFQTIYFGGYYKRPLLPGETATLRTYADGDLVAEEPISTTEQRPDCYAVELILYDLEPDAYRYRYTVKVGIEGLAEGEFTVRAR